MDDMDLDDLLAEGPPVQSFRPSQKETPKRQGKSALDNDFYGTLAAQADGDADSEVSDADAKQMARALGGLDDMDADLFGGQLPKKKGSIKSGSRGTPRTRTRTPRSGSNTPRTAIKPSSPQRVASPSGSDGPMSPRGSRTKLSSSKPGSPPPPPPVIFPKPGTAPGQLTDVYKASENLKPGQTLNTDGDRPSTTPKVKAKFNFGEFDEDDPLAGLGLSDEDSFSQKKKTIKNALKSSNVDSPRQQVKQRSSESPRAPLQRQKTAEDLPVSPPPAPKEAESGAKRSLFDRPPTRSGSGKSESDEPSPPSKQAGIKKKDEVIFSDGDDFLMGLETKPDKGDVPYQAKSELEGSQRSAKSFMDGLLGKGDANKQLESKDRKSFAIDTAKLFNKEEPPSEEDFLFGSYQPSAASGSRPGSRRSVRFQDDDLFGSDTPPSRGRSQSPKKTPDNMEWLEQAMDKVTPKPDNKPAPSSPRKTASTPEIKHTEKAKAPSAREWLGLHESESSEEEFFRPKRTPPPSGRRPLSGEKKANVEDWLGLSEKKSVAETRDIVEKSPTVSVGQPISKTKDDYLGLGDEIDIDDMLITRPESPSFQGERPSALGKSDDKSRELFSTPAASRDTSSVSMRQPARRADGLPTGRKAVAGFSRHETLDDDLDGGQRLYSSPLVQQSPVGAESTTTKDMTIYAQPRDTPAVMSPAKVNPTAVPQYSQSLQNFLEEPISQPTARVHSASSLSDQTLQQQPFIQQPLPQQQLVQQPLPQQQQLSQQQLSQQQVPQQHVPQMPQQLQAHPDFQAQHQYMTQELQSQNSGSRQGTPSIPTLHSSQMLFSTGGSRLLDQAGSLDEAYAKIRTLEIEKQYSESLLESSRRRYEEELTAVETSYKNRVQILDDSHRKKESRLREDNEQLMMEHLSRVRRMEEEKASIAAQNYVNLEDLERSKAAEMEKLREQHRLANAESKREQEELVERMKRVKALEIDAVVNSHDTSRSLTAVVEQIQSNAKDLGELQHKVDSWHRQGLDDREISLKSKDEQLRILQERLSRQEADNENERKRLEDLIARMETQLREQTRILDEERWKIKQELARLESQQKSLAEERRVWVDQQAREREMIERTRSSFLEEQRSSMNQINGERRAVAEERTKFNIDQKMMREKMTHDTIRSAQAEAEYDVLVKSMGDEKAKSSQRKNELLREEDRMNAERTRMEKEKAQIDAEKERLSEMASTVKQKSAEVDSLSNLVSQSQKDGERSLLEARQVQSQHYQRLDEINTQKQNIKNIEEHIADEKLRLAKEKKEVENLKNSSLCTNCRTPLRAMGTNMQHTSMMSNGVSSPMVLQSGGMMHHHSTSQLNFSVNAIESITSSIAADRSIRMWKIQAMKDKDYLEEESMYLETLKHSPYH